MDGNGHYYRPKLLPMLPEYYLNVGVNVNAIRNAVFIFNVTVILSQC